MNDKLKLECVILRSLLEYPDKINDFLDKTPLKCFSEMSAELLNLMLNLKQKELLNIETLNVEARDGLKNSPFYVNFLGALPNVLVLNLSQNLIKAYKIEQQKALIKTLEKASENGELVDIEFLQQKMNVEAKNFMNLRQWAEFYANKPKMPSVKVGVDFLDSAFNGGLELGQLVLIGGDPEAGKTMLGAQIFEYIALHNKVAFFCFEFTIEQYLKRVAEKNIKTNYENVMILNDGYHIFEVADNIRSLYRQGVKVFFIDSQMRLTHTQGRNMEEEETMKFSTLARLCHSLNILIILVIQNAKGDKENPMGSKKGGHEASIIIRIERVAPKKDDLTQAGNLYDENARLIMVQKNKQTGKHFKEKVFFNTQSLKFYSLDKNDMPIYKSTFNEVQGELNE